MKEKFYSFFKPGFLMLFVCLLCSANVWAQSKQVTGVITGDADDPMVGATVQVKGIPGGVIADIDGNFSIKASVGQVLMVSFLGMEPQEVKVGSQNHYVIKMKPAVNEFDEVTVVAFAKQRKESVISAVTTINPQDLKVPSSNLTTALAGRMSGLIAYQRSGEPGKDNAEFFVRGVTTFGYKKDPLILIDNIELTTNDLARLNVDDIAQFSIMKDATATALYGARGANGVILVTTKQGQRGRPKVSARVEQAVSTPRRMVKLTDPITYMKLNNEAVNTRVDPAKGRNEDLMYSQEKIENTIAGTNPYVYPAVDWYKELFNDYSLSTRANMSLSGGGTAVRYYVAASYTKDGGAIKNEKLNNYNSNIDYRRYSVRSNINMDLSKSTEFIIRVNGNFDDYTGPRDGGESLYNKVMKTSPVAYPKAFPATGEYARATHVLFGNLEEKYINPYADMVCGYKESNYTLVVAQAELKQKLDFIFKGLDARVLVNTTRTSYGEVSRSTKPYYYEVSAYDRATDTYTLSTPTGGEEALSYSEGGKNIESTNYLEASMSYNRTFDRHAVSGMLVFMRQEKKVTSASSLQKSLAHRNQGLSGRFTYALDNKYFTEFNFGYNGSERFAAHERYGFFPSIGVGYIISNEPFWKPLSNTIDKLKFKLTYGLVGNDAIGSEEDRFFYLSDVNINDNDRGQDFGTEYNRRISGISNSRYPNLDITWEKSKKTNIGVELGMFNNALEIQADLFYEYRTQIFQGRALLPSSMGLSAGANANLGEASSRGVDLSATYSYIHHKDFWARAMGNFTFARGKFEKYEERDFASYGLGYQSRIGQPLAFNFGYIAERLFIDDNDIANSPSQTDLGGVQAGDIKYKDINKDGKITSDDKVFLGYPNQPEITYGFGFSTGYKGFDLSVFFQGNARVSFFLNPKKIAPFTGENSNEIQNCLAIIADSHWSEDNRDMYAFWPRLSPTYIKNNNELSTWWMHDGSFLRLKTVEMGYTLPKKLTRKLGLETARFYVTGNDLLSFSKFNLWDSEMGDNGLGYPIQRIYNIGLNINF